MATALQVLFVGDRDRPEFREAFDTLQPLARVVGASSMNDAQALLSGGFQPDVIVVAQPRPGAVSQQALCQLRRQAVLAPVVGLMGSWCEGETRSGSPLPGVTRIYWHRWESGFLFEFQRLLQGYCPNWILPSTARGEERQVRATVTSLSRQHGVIAGVIAVVSPNQEMRRWLADVCRAAGYDVTMHSPWDDSLTSDSPRERPRNVDAVLWECDECSAMESPLLHSVRERVDQAPVLAILNFPRIEDRRCAMAAGAAAVISKPLGPVELLEQLKQLIGRRRGSLRSAI